MNAEQVKFLTHSSFALWSQYSGLEVDHRVFTFDDHRYLLPIYLDQSKEMAWMKSAQMGATIYILLRLLWYARHHTVKCGLFFPTSDGVNRLSKDRLTPLIASNAEMLNAMHDTDSLGLKHIDNINGRTSSIYMLHLGGTASKDSVPLDVLGFDEVRLVSAQDIDQAIERVSHSTYKVKMFVSTAGLPHSDVHSRFSRGTQNYWHIKCNCFPLDQTIIVKKKGTSAPIPLSFRDLKDSWKDYQALSWSTRRSEWQYKDVTAFHSNGVQSLIKGTLRNGTTVTCTPDHRFFQYSGQTAPKKSINEIAIQDVPTTGSSTFTNHLNDLLMARALPDNGEAKLNKTNTYVGKDVIALPWDNLTLYMLGAYVAEGSWHTKYNRINISQLEGKPIREATVEWCKSNNLNPYLGKSGISICLTSRPDLIELFKKCGELCDSKQFPQEFLGAPNTQLSIILAGYRAGDGHKFINNIDTRGYASNREWSATTTSKTLKDQLLFIGMRLGTPLYVTYIPSKTLKGFKKPKKEAWEMSYNPNSVFAKPQFEGGLSKVSLKNVIDAGSREVCDITVEDNHNYVLADSGLLAHNCSDGFIPSECFPDCIVEHGKDVYLRCPKCKTRIMDPQNGNYVAHNPGADFPSYHISQFISKYISVKEIWESYKTTTNKTEFFNAKLGKPFVDAENMPVNDDVLENCVNKDLKWAKDYVSLSRRDFKGCAMGVDQHGGNNYAVILRRDPKSGKKQLVHLEIIDNSNPNYWEGGRPVTPFKRLYELMKEFDVGLCILDAMPNYNEAQTFAREFPGRVFLSFYGDAANAKDLVQWTDRPRDKIAVKKGSQKIKFKWQVTINRYMGIDFALRQFVDRDIDMPHPDALLQVVKNTEKGRYESVPICRDIFWLHMKSVVRRIKDLDPETGKARPEWVYVGRDPHFLHAFLYSCVAFERLKRRGIMIF